MSHTPSPWKTEFYNGLFGHRDWIQSGGHLPIRIFSPKETSGIRIDQEIAVIISGRDNALLIAAAPDYDDIVRGIADDLGMAEWATPEHGEKILQSLIEKWHGKARAAIAKAEGRS